jgi:hypothetical protein
LVVLPTESKWLVDCRCRDHRVRVVIAGVYNRMMTKTIKPDVAPGEFKCRTCYTMWSNYMENPIPCTDTTERYGLHNFDFTNRIIWIWALPCTWTWFCFIISHCG